MIREEVIEAIIKGLNYQEKAIIGLVEGEGIPPYTMLLGGEEIPLSKMKKEELEGKSITFSNLLRSFKLKN